MALRKGTITEGGIKIAWQQTAEGVSYADGKVATPSPANMDAKIAYKGAKLPVVDTPPVEVPLPGVKLDHVYLAENALNKDRQQAKNGDNVHVIPDALGKFPLKYAGIAAPILTGGAPIFHNGEIAFDNEPSTLFNSDFFMRVAYPYELTIIGRKLPGTGWEQYLNSWDNDISIGDAGNVLRAGDAEPKIHEFPNSPTNYFEVFVIHVLAEAGKQTMWLNGKLLGEITAKIRTTSRRKLNSIGVGTNNAQWNFIAEYVKHGKLSDEDRYQHLLSVAKIHGQKNKPASPYASNVSISKDSVYIAKYDYNGSLPQDVAKTQFRWLGFGPGGLGGVKIIGSGLTLPLSALSGFSSVRVEVKVYDTSGNSFRYVSMPFMNK